MFKNLIKTAIGVGALALGIKVVKDILQADEEEEQKLIKVESEEDEAENKPEE